MVLKKPRLLLADDHQGILHETRDLLRSKFDVVGTATDGIALVEAAAKLRPDAVVTDIAMPRLNGIDASREILGRGLCGVVVLLTVSAEAPVVKAALEAGIRAYVLKLNAGEELIPAICVALQGGTFVSAGIAACGDSEQK
ncbi:MAG: response regulator transcription factor [Bryobacteraceae bacterium]